MAEEVTDPENDQTDDQEKPLTFKQRIWEIIFEAETPLGKWFDITLIWMILLSVLTVMLESVDALALEYGEVFKVLEWVFTVLFTVEYLLRIWLVRKKLRYMRSFFGIIDFLSILPMYLMLIPGMGASSSFIIIRILRLLRMFRVLKMVNHIRGANVIMRGLMASKAKITVFFFTELFFAVIAGTLMYIVESGQPNTDFTSIPRSIYYAIVSITTVGYGDITAQTVLGQMITTVMILAGYAIIAVPTGIVTSEMVKAEVDETTDACPSCGTHGHLLDATYCRKCGDKLDHTEVSSQESEESDA